MKKILIICILIVSIIFISGCTSEEKTNSETSTNSQTSDLLIKPSDLPKGYFSSEYTTYAISQGDSFEMLSDFFSVINSKNKYEGDIPSGKKRIATTFKLSNYDNIKMSVLIYEFDSNSGLKEYISGMESLIIEKQKEYETTPYPDFYKIEPSSVGDYSLQYFYGSYGEFDEKYYGDVGNFIFCYKNYIVQISTSPDEKETIQEETLKVAKAIKSRLD